MKSNPSHVRQNRWIILIGFILLGISCSPSNPEQDTYSSTSDGTYQHHWALPFYDSKDLSPKWPSPKEVESKRFHRIDDFSLTDQNGNTVRRRDLRDKVIVANFFFTTCSGTCPKLSNNLKKIQEALPSESEVVLLSFSVTPKLDQVEILKAYAQQYGVLDNRWHLLTGDKEKIYKLARQSFFSDDGESFRGQENDFIHSDRLTLIDREGRIRGVYNGTSNFDIQKALEDIQTLEKQSSQV